MMKIKNAAIALMVGLTVGAAMPAAAAAKSDCPMDNRKAKAISERSGKKIQKAFELYSNGQTKEALVLLKEIDPSSDYDKAYVWRFIGNLTAELGDMSEALKFLTKANDMQILSGGDQAATMRLVADLNLQEKNYQTAIKTYNDWMNFSCKRDDDVVHTRIGLAYNELKQYDKAVAAANTAIKYLKKPNKAPYQIKLTAFYNQKQYKNSVKVLETMIPLFPNDKRLWTQLSQFYLLTEDMKKAASTYDLAYSMGALESEANLRRLSQLISQEGGHERAARLMVKHIKEGKIKENSRHFQDVASFYARAKEDALAAKYYGMAAKLEGNDVKLLQKQANFLNYANQYKDAIKIYDLVIKAEANKADSELAANAYFDKARAYVALKQYKSAYSNILKAKGYKQTKRYATSYQKYIEEKARVLKITL